MKYMLIYVVVSILGGEPKTIQTPYNNLQDCVRDVQIIKNNSTQSLFVRSAYCVRSYQ